MDALLSQLSELLSAAVDVFLHLDAHLNQWAALLGVWLYALLFVIVFAETGLVVTPFLPGDSLLFAVGALAATENAVISLSLVIPVLMAAGILGDAVNYSVGYRLGPKVFRQDSRFLNHEHLMKAQKFYERHGGKTIIWARFMPIVRTFAPFVAGIGKMAYRRFVVFNVAGAVLWVLLFVVGGYWFGNIPAIKRNFQFVVLAIIVVSFLPLLAETLRNSGLFGRKQPQS